MPVSVEESSQVLLSSENLYFPRGAEAVNPNAGLGSDSLRVSRSHRDSPPQEPTVARPQQCSWSQLPGCQVSTPSTGTNPEPRRHELTCRGARQRLPSQLQFLFRGVGKVLTGAGGLATGPALSLQLQEASSVKHRPIHLQGCTKTEDDVNRDTW